MIHLAINQNKLEWKNLLQILWIQILHETLTDFSDQATYFIGKGDFETALKFIGQVCGEGEKLTNWQIYKKSELICRHTCCVALRNGRTMTRGSSPLSPPCPSSCSRRGTTSRLRPLQNKYTSMICWTSYDIIAKTTIKVLYEQPNPMALFVRSEALYNMCEVSDITIE